jgi:hypothetical protein
MTSQIPSTECEVRPSMSDKVLHFISHYRFDSGSFPGWKLCTASICLNRVARPMPRHRGFSAPSLRKPKGLHQINLVPLYCTIHISRLEAVLLSRVWALKRGQMLQVFCLHQRGRQRGSGVHSSHMSAAQLPKPQATTRPPRILAVQYTPRQPPSYGKARSANVRALCGNLKPSSTGSNRPRV